MTIMSAMPGITAPPLPGRPRADAAAASTRPLPATRTAHPGDDAPWPYGSPQIDLDDVAEDFALAAAREGPQFTRSRRADGWTPDRQRGFLDYIAQGLTVSDAATLVGLSATSAYAFRQRAAGAAFAVGWQAALLLQRNRLVDELTSRAFRGNTDTVTNARGETVERHRHDNRLALALLTRLDKIAAADLPDRTGDARAARLAAQDWDRYLDIIGTDASPAQAGLFLSLRATEGEAAAIAPIVALARADLYRRTRAGHPGEVQVHDLDPARRHAWSAADWARAEAGGLVSLAAPEPAAAEVSRTSQLPQHSEAEEPGVWWCETADDWRTAFPPPEDFDGEEEGTFGDGGYSRSLSDAELAAVEAWQARDTEAQRGPAEAARVRFFAKLVGAADEQLGEVEERAGHPLPVRAEPVEALPYSSGGTDEAGEGGMASPPAVRAELVEAPCFVPQTMTREEEGQSFDSEQGKRPPRALAAAGGCGDLFTRANGCGESVVSPTGPDAEVNSASSDGAMAPPAVTGAEGRVRSFATDLRAG